MIIDLIIIIMVILLLGVAAAIAVKTYKLGNRPVSSKRKRNGWRKRKIITKGSLLKNL